MLQRVMYHTGSAMIEKPALKTFTVFAACLSLIACKKDEQANVAYAGEKKDPLAMEAQLNILALPGRIEFGRNNPALDWVTPFETATGCKVKATVLENNDLLEPTLANADYDLLIAPELPSLPDVFQPIDFSRLRSFKELDKRFLANPLVASRSALPFQWKFLPPDPLQPELLIEMETTRLLAKLMHPNCAYAWMEWSLSAKVQAEIAASLGTIPAVPAACLGNDLLGDDACAQRMETPVAALPETASEKPE